VLVADANRQTLIHSRRPLGKPMPPVATPKGRSALSDAVATGKPAVDDLVRGAVLQDLMVAVAVPISSGRSELIAMALMPATQLSRSLTARPLPRGWDVRLMDSVGQVIAPSGQPPSTEPGWTAQPRRLEQTLAHAPWKVQVEVGLLAFYKDRLLLLALLLLGAAATVTGAVWATRSLAGSLEGSIQRLGQGLQPDHEPHGRALREGQTVVAELEAAREEMQRLVVARVDAQEHERLRIARELHDSLQQDLAALGLHLKLISGSEKLAPQALKDLCVKASALAHGSILELDRIVKDLRPWLLEQFGTAQALEQLVDSYRQSTRLQIELELIGSAEALDALPTPVASGVFRVTQECLTNVAKHAQASFVHIVLDHTDLAWVDLQIADDGVGLAPTDHEKPHSMGLRGMAERVAALDGVLEFVSIPQGGTDGGTTIKVKLPIKAG
jgi:signal transduction histidine kinase